MKLGISGHQRLKEPAAWGWVSDQIAGIVRQTPGPVVGITSLAIGADQIFADIILHHDGALEVIVPFPEYAGSFAEAHDKQEYERLLSRASKIETLRQKGSDQEAYLAAGQRVVDLTDLLIAVWDEKPAAGLGGTADIVDYALRQQKSIIHLNPVLKRTRNL